MNSNFKAYSTISSSGPYTTTLHTTTWLQVFKNSTLKGRLQPNDWLSLLCEITSMYVPQPGLVIHLFQYGLEDVGLKWFNSLKVEEFHNSIRWFISLGSGSGTKFNTYLPLSIYRGPKRNQMKNSWIISLGGRTFILNWTLTPQESVCGPYRE